jgi:hypothetical protein
MMNLDEDFSKTIKVISFEMKFNFDIKYNHYFSIISFAVSFIAV